MSSAQVMGNRRGRRYNADTLNHYASLPDAKG